MKNLTFFCFLLFFNLCAFCQQTVTIAGDAYAPGGVPRNVTILSTKKIPVGDEFSYLARIPVKLNNTFNYKLPLSKPTLLVIHYWGGKSNVVYAIPGDSIHIIFEELAKPDTFKSMLLTFQYKERTHYSGSDPARMAFFQLLADKTGLPGEPPFKMSTDTTDFLIAYKAKVNEVYQLRLQFFKEEDSKYHFTTNFKAAALNEIQGDYIDNLVYVCLVGKFIGKFPPDYFKEVDNYEVTWDKFKNSRSNFSLCYTKVMYYNLQESAQTPESKLAAAFENCLHFKDDSVRNYMLALILSRNMEKGAANFDDLIDKFQEVCTNPAYVSDVLNLYKPKVVGRPLPDEVLNTSLKTVGGQRVKLKDIISNGKPVVIDFWASWCGPCKREIPKLMQIAEKYKDKVDFRFISLDIPEKEADWLKAIDNTNFKGAQYLIQDKALTDFARIKSIPRYLVIDKEGKLNNYSGPDLLTNEQGFENTIKAVISN